MFFGVQLFGILADWTGDVLDALKMVKEAGASSIEPCIAPEEVKEGYEHVVWPADWLMENAEKIKALGLKISSAHVFAKNPAVHAEKLTMLAEKTGITQYVLKTPTDLSPESLQQGALIYMKLADELAPAGISLLLHNEWTDIDAKIAGKTAYEHFTDLCLGKVFMQVDAGWVMYAGEDPEAFLMRNAYRVKSLHYKDFTETDGKKVQTSPGTGTLDCRACYRFATAYEVPQLIDQDSFTGDKKEALTAAITYLDRLKNTRERSVSYLNTYNIETGEIKVL